MKVRRGCVVMMNIEITERFKQLYDVVINLDVDEVRTKKITQAINRIYRALRDKYQISADIPLRNYTLNPQQLNAADLSTIEAMLDIKIQKWRQGVPYALHDGMQFNGIPAGFVTYNSLREELNAVWYIPFCRDWFGKTSELITVEKAVKQIKS